MPGTLCVAFRESNPPAEPGQVRVVGGTGRKQPLGLILILAINRDSSTNRDRCRVVERERREHRFGRIVLTHPAIVLGQREP